MRLVYHPAYHLNLGDHVFPSTKFHLIRRWLAEGSCFRDEDFVIPVPATDDELLTVHSRAWVDALMGGTLTTEQIITLEIPYSPAMAQAFRLMTGGSVLAARLALDEGRSMNIGGGFHHAFPNHGEGFCAINDVAVAIRVLQREGKIKKAMVVDCDVHHGNGTAAVFLDDPGVFTISLHQHNNYPTWKPPSNIDIHVAEGLGDDEYVRRLDRVLRSAVAGFQPELIAYIAGADPYYDDQLGGLELTFGGLARRDRTVFDIAGDIPVFAALAGGYARHLEDTVRIHGTTALVAAGCTIPKN